MDATVAQVAAPTNMEEVEQLVKRLYEPGSSSLVSQIDEQLKLLQLSPDGWQLADALLGSQEANVRFFGALTFQVKLNNEGARLDAATAESILLRLLSWTIQLDAASEGPLVRKKLCATLGTYILRSPVPWARPLLHLAFLFQQGIASTVDLKQLPTSQNLDEVLATLSESQIVVLLWLSSSLATDAAKIDSSNPAVARVHDQMETTVHDAHTVMRHALRPSDSPNAEKIRAETLACFLNWVNYAQPMWPAKPEPLQSLRNLIGELSPLLYDQALQAEAMDVFRDILESYTSFFQKQHMELMTQIIQQHVQPRFLQGLQDREPEVLPIVQFVIAYGSANIQHVVEESTDKSGSQCIIDLHLAILQSPGYPGDDDEVSAQSIEFWNTYVEYVNDIVYSDGHRYAGAPKWTDAARDVCSRLSTLLWSKMRTPPSSVAQNWTDAESEAFREFRMDAADLLLSVYLHLGRQMLQDFVNVVLSSLAAKNWHDVEATLYCINTLAENVIEDSEAEMLLGQIFGSSLFRDIADFSQSIPSQTRRTAIDTLGAYGHYIEHHAEYLPDTIRFLFASLENTGLCLSAAKSIATLCSTCRASLTGELPGFLEQYNRFTASETSEPYTNEKVIGAIAAIIQAIPSESTKLAPLAALLDIVDAMIAQATNIAAQGDSEKAHTSGVSALECLASIGKGLQEPDDALVNLYDGKQPESDSRRQFWQGESGQLVHSRILKSCQNVLQIFPSSGEAVDAVCHVLKSGFAEAQPGPFVFPPTIIVGFLEQCSPTTPHVESVLSMISKFVVHHSRESGVRINNEIDRIYQRVVAFIQVLNHPQQDPSMSQCCLDILTRMVSRYANVILGLSSDSGEVIRTVLDFAIKAIDSVDLMPKRSACELWTQLLRFNPAAATASPNAEALRVRSQQISTAYGPLLCQALIRQILGRAQRSELDHLCEPLKALVQMQSQTRQWLEAALVEGSTTATASDSSQTRSGSGEASDADKRRFVQAVVALRGDNRKTRDVVKNFYATCRGTVVSYTP